MGRRADDERSIRQAQALLKQLAEALEEERIRKGLTKTAFAKFLGISPPSYMAWRTGAANPTLLTIARVVDRLGSDDVCLKTLVGNYNHDGQHVTASACRESTP
ncbi:helix-turn-helix transcriptional regulator [Rhizobium sp. 18065]|uniref:helix-turn-helix transcriptional regulator n=1 Tax=Rhizobium sp. 18065 TaxID=2681411 RepID=UPI00135B7118|nr:helix-turn-helix transcriptional regulator [Rhizobium sp. 18065]